MKPQDYNYATYDGGNNSISRYGVRNPAPIQSLGPHVLSGNMKNDSDTTLDGGSEDIRK